MARLDVDFVGGDFNMAVNSPVAAVFDDQEFMAPGPSPLRGAGGLEGDDADCTGFLCMPRRPFHWHVNKHGVHTFTNEQLGLAEGRRAHTTLSFSTSGRPTCREATVQSFAATHHKHDVS